MIVLVRNRSARRRRAVAAALALCLAALAAPVQAQSLKDLSGALGSVTGGSGGLPSVEQASPSNLTGVLEYCLKNKALFGIRGAEGQA